MITERTLRQWRRDALRHRQHPLLVRPVTAAPGEESNYVTLLIDELDNRILRLTQELLDQYLLRRP
jgi:hypothetical protein